MSNENYENYQVEEISMSPDELQNAVAFKEWLRINDKVLTAVKVVKLDPVIIKRKVDGVSSFPEVTYFQEVPAIAFRFLNDTLLYGFCDTNGNKIEYITPDCKAAEITAEVVGVAAYESEERMIARPMDEIITFMLDEYYHALQIHAAWIDRLVDNIVEKKAVS